MWATVLLSKHLKKQQSQLKKQSASHAVTQVAVQDLHLGSVINNKAVSAETVDANTESIQTLTAEQAALVRVKMRENGFAISPWRIIVGQLLAGAVFTVLAWLMTGQSGIAMSVAYGVMAVVLPAAVFARGLMSRFSSLNAVTAGLGFFVWELVKIVATVVLIAIAPNVVANLDWLAMLIGLIATMQVVFVLLWLLPKFVPK